jgi:hypothetical protein
MGARETNMPEKETAAVRRDGELLTSTAAVAEGGSCQQTPGNCRGATPFVCRRGDQICATIGYEP